MEQDHTFSEVSSDQQQNGLGIDLSVDRDTASRFGLKMVQIDNSLYDAFGQRSVSVDLQSAQSISRGDGGGAAILAVPRHSQADLDQHVWRAGERLAGHGDQRRRRDRRSGAGHPDPDRDRDARRDADPLVPGRLGRQCRHAHRQCRDRPAQSCGLPGAAGDGGLTVKPVVISRIFANSAANNAVRTAAQAAIASTGASVASAGSAVATGNVAMVPLSAFARYAPGSTPLAVNHQSQFVAATLSFNLAKGKSLSDAEAAIARAEQDIHMPGNLIRGFAGAALLYTQSLADEKVLVLAALAAIYIVLGILYESFMHPITILSTLPSAGVGAVLALLAFGLPLTIIALIGIILLIGIVKKNAILMIDFALQAERELGMDSREAIYHAAVVRFRPIMMTTTAALLGALPLCFSFGEGGELREPLGISIVGGLIVSQALTLYTTPIVYLYLDRLRMAFSRHRD